MAYVPPKKQHTHKRIAVAFFLLFLFGVCVAVGVQLWHQPSSEEEVSFSICGLNEEKSRNKLQYSGDAYMISDYHFYGESLNLFAQTYTPDKQDDVKRKSIELTNLCNGEALIYTMENGADRQIDLIDLEEGFYALSINDNLVKKRLAYQEKLQSEPFYSVQRDGQVKKITLLADASMGSPKLKDHALFLQVEQADKQSTVYDVFIDPYGNRMLNGMYQGAVSGNGLNEATEMQKAAELLKQKLESYGLTVMLAKEQADEALGYYGADGIMKKAYESHAKYYLELGMNGSTQSAYRGTEIYYSNYASNTMANAIMYALQKQTSLTASNAYTWTEHSDGVSTAFLAKGKDGKEIYDMQPSLRESGGRITAAGQYSDAANENLSFVKDTHQGMQALSVNFIYATNSKDAAIWKKEQEKIIDVLAQAFVKAIHVAE